MSKWTQVLIHQDGKRSVGPVFEPSAQMRKYDGVNSNWRTILNLPDLVVIVWEGVGSTYELWITVKTDG